MPAIFVAAPSSSSLLHASAPGLRFRPFVPRASLFVCSVAFGLYAYLLSNPSSLLEVEPKLVLLLRGMALVKAIIALSALGLVSWRFGREVTFPVAVGYVAGVSSLVTATVLIWFVSRIPEAAVIFHVGLLGLLVLGWREGGSALRLRSIIAERRAVSASRSTKRFLGSGGLVSSR